MRREAQNEISGQEYFMREPAFAIRTKINEGFACSTSLPALRPAQHIAEHRVRRLVVLSKLLKLTSTDSTFGTHSCTFPFFLLEFPCGSTAYATWFSPGALARTLHLSSLTGNPATRPTGSTYRMQMRERSFSTRLLLFILSAALNLAMIGCGRTQAAAPPPAPEVRVARVIQ